jgi:D-galactarolactone cycloisomerase
MLEFDTTNNLFVNDLLVEPLDIEIQVSKNKGFVKIPDGPGLGVEPNLEWIHSFQE